MNKNLSNVKNEARLTAIPKLAYIILTLRRSLHTGNSFSKTLKRYFWLYTRCAVACHPQIVKTSMIDLQMLHGLSATGHLTDYKNLGAKSKKEIKYVMRES